MTASNIVQDFIDIWPLIFRLEIGRYLVAAGLMSLIIWAFWRAGLSARKTQSRNATTADIRREILMSVRTALVFSFVGFGIYLAVKANWLTLYKDFAEYRLVYLALSVVAMVVTHDAYFYWTHRAMHHPRLFRMFHRTHHKSHTPTPWAAYSFDVPEAVLTLAFVPLWISIVPTHDLSLWVFMAWQIIRNVMGHAGVEVHPIGQARSRFFGWLNTTTHHDLHHQDARYNFGLYFSWWDRMMGTEHPNYIARVEALRANNASHGAIGDKQKNELLARSQ